ncbi:type IV pilus modification PilV family protein [Campylobacter sputorum]|uniref:type IV pilus modification PilV family protein n=1 Tax=Campylobacter sputorum TaxID=206 RepID=UPI00053BE020|nr:type II secretion system protein [Campylobacter sputorum]
MKKAFSIIEVVLAIVIMGLTMVAVPTIISQSTISNLYALKQEAILSAKMQMHLMFSMPWDSNSMKETDLLPKVTLTNSTVEGLKNAIGENGNFTQDYKNNKTRQNLPINAYINNQASKPLKNGNLYGLNHLHEYERNLNIESPTDKRGIRDMIVPIKTKFNVSYIDDKLQTGSYIDGTDIKFNFTSNQNTTNTTNIKMIELHTCFIENVKTGECTDENKNIILRTYSSNIAPSHIITREIN